MTCIICVFQFISADVYGVFCQAFCDFGDKFEVFDTNGEDPKDAFISNITKVTYTLHLTNGIVNTLATTFFKQTFS